VDIIKLACYFVDHYFDVDFVDETILQHFDTNTDITVAMQQFYGEAMDLSTKADAIVDTLKSSLIDNDTSIVEYNSIVNYFDELRACGSCGVKNYPSKNFEKYFLTDLPESLKYNEYELYDYNSLPIDKQILISSFASNEARYYLHPELVIVDNENHMESHTYLCKDCVVAIRNRDIPPYNVRKIDYGIWTRNKSLNPLNPVERSLIAQSRVFTTIFKFTVLNTTNNRYAGIQATKGHCIAFPQESVEAMCKILPNLDNLSKSISIVFVGPNNQKEKIQKCILESKIFKVDVENIYAWLRMLKNSHQFYANITILDSSNMIKELQRIPEALASGIVVAENSTTIGIDRTTDTSGVRNYATEESTSTKNIFGEESAVDLNNIALDYSSVLNKNTDLAITSTKLTEHKLKSIRKSITKSAFLGFVLVTTYTVTLGSLTRI